MEKNLYDHFIKLWHEDIYVHHVINNKPQQEGIPTKPGYKELFILILQKTSNNN